MWLSSWATTPSSSTRFIFSSKPVVTAIAACLGSRPVANAFGAGSSITYTPGFGGRGTADGERDLVCFPVRGERHDRPDHERHDRGRDAVSEHDPEGEADQGHDDHERDDEQHASALVRSDQVV